MLNFFESYFGFMIVMGLCYGALLLSCGVIFYWIYKCFSQRKVCSPPDKNFELLNSNFQRELDKIYQQLEHFEKKKEEITVTNRNSKYDHIYQAFDSGQSITDIAKKFQRTQGEIELILNFRKVS